MSQTATLILTHGKIHTLDRQNPQVGVMVITNGKILTTGSHKQVMSSTAEGTQAVDLQGYMVIPGLNDSHLHLIRGRLNYNLELRREGMSSLAGALCILKNQTDRTSSSQWVHVVGGWSGFQFTERRMPTLKELNEAAPDASVFAPHLCDRVLLSRAALKAVGYTRAMPGPASGETVCDNNDNPTGMLIAKPNAMVPYSTLAKGPELLLEMQVSSIRQFVCELNRPELTSVIDTGGELQNYPEDYEIIEQLYANKWMTVRIAYNLFAQRPKQELEDPERWTNMLKSGQRTDFYRVNGAGEILVLLVTDFEDFLQPRPDPPEDMEDELECVVRHLVEYRWPFRLHATCDELVNRMLDVFEKASRDIPFNGLHWSLDHVEATTERNIEHIRVLRSGIAVRHRMALQGKYSVDRYGKDAVKHTPPVAKTLVADAPIGLGADTTRVTSYNPQATLYRLASGRTAGGMATYDGNNRLPHDAALELWTTGSAWFSSEQGKKGRVKKDQLANLVVLFKDYFSVPEEEIRGTESVVTIVDGKVVYAAGHFISLAPPAIPVVLDRSPVVKVSGHFCSTPPIATKTGTLVQMH